MKKYLEEDGELFGYESDDLKTSEKRNSRKDQKISKKRALSRQETPNQMKDKFNFSPSFIEKLNLTATTVPV